jgi:hypothetical protein
MSAKCRWDSMMAGEIVRCVNILYEDETREISFVANHLRACQKEREEAYFRNEKDPAVQKKLALRLIGLYHLITALQAVREGFFNGHEADWYLRNAEAAFGKNNWNIGYLKLVALCRDAITEYEERQRFADEIIKRLKGEQV